MADALGYFRHVTADQVVAGRGERPGITVLRRFVIEHSLDRGSGAPALDLLQIPDELPGGLELVQAPHDVGRSAVAEPVFGPGFTQPVLFRGGKAVRHLHPLEQGRFCDGTAVGPWFLGHSFPTDVLLFRLTTEAPVFCPTADEPGRSAQPGRIALTSLVEAICLAASRELQIDEGELAGNWCPMPEGGNRQVYLFLYDLLPGGAGYTRLVQRIGTEGVPVTVAHAETRVWQRRDGRWKHVHFHRSPL